MSDERGKIELSREELDRLTKDRFERPMPRRFYEKAAVEGEAAPFCITLDGRALRTPLKAPLELPTRALARAVAEEWNAQGETINPFDMPLTRLANAAIDRVRGRRDEVIASICAFGAHDLLCYRASQPLAFAHLQGRTWDPLLEWAREQTGARFVLAEGVMPVEQPEETIAALRARYEVFGEFQLAGLSNMATLTGSAILPLAVAAGRLAPGDAWEASVLDETWNARQWGEDAEAAARLELRRREFLSAARLLELLRAA